GAEDAGAPWLVLWGEQHGRVVVEADEGTVGPAVFLRLTDDHGAHDLTFLHTGVRDRVLHRGDEHVADRGRGPGGRAQHADHRELSRSSVVGDAYAGVRADQASVSSSAFSMSAGRGAAAPASPIREMTSTTRQRFVAL